MATTGGVRSADAGLVTVPNAVSALRILGVPVFVYLILGPHSDGWALAVLIVGGGSDWVDGKLARLLGQYSRIGELLDPVADRLYMVVVPVAFAVRGVIPWWIVGVLLARELVLAATLPAYRSRGLGPPQVHYLGKAATFTLMIAMPVLLVGYGDYAVAPAFHTSGWALLLWGIGLYAWTGVLYVVQAVMTVRTLPRASVRAGGVPHAGW